MRRFRIMSVGFVVVACFFLTGFKQSHQRHSAVIKKNQPDKLVQNEQKKLDLTLPSNQDGLKVIEPEMVSQVQKNTAQDTFARDDDDKTRAIELKGNIIMSQEPEAGKIKSADGAGIMVNLHP